MFQVPVGRGITGYLPRCKAGNPGRRNLSITLAIVHAKKCRARRHGKFQGGKPGQTPGA